MLIAVNEQGRASSAGWREGSDPTSARRAVCVRLCRPRRLQWDPCVNPRRCGVASFRTGAWVLMPPILHAAARPRHCSRAVPGDRDGSSRNFHDRSPPAYGATPNAGTAIRPSAIAVPAGGSSLRQVQSGPGRTLGRFSPNSGNQVNECRALGEPFANNLWSSLRSSSR